MTFAAIRAKSLPADASVRVIAQRPDGAVEPLIWFYRYDPKFARTYYLSQADHATGWTPDPDLGRRTPRSRLITAQGR